MTRVLIFAIVLVALLAFAVPAFAFNGFRADYTSSIYCQTCHTLPGDPGPLIYNKWAATKHAVSGAGDQPTRSPEGSSCAGCHTANYDPGKAIPTPTATAYLPASSSATPSPVPTKTTISYGYPNAPDPSNAAAGNAASSELDVGCSSCHYGKSGPANYGGDANNTAHSAQMKEMANADICGQCHSRYAYTATTYNITPTPRPTPITMVQPQYAIGWQMLGNPGNGFVADPLSTNLIVPHPGWDPAHSTPSPNPSATTAAGLMQYWKIGGVDSQWQQSGHDGSAAQYPEWASEGHANSLTVLTSDPGWAFMPENVKASCLKCHSADYRIAPDGEKPTSSQVKYGITCVGCHTPHDKGTQTGAWDEAFDAQVITDSSKDLCVSCHNGELGGGEAVPGTTVHHPMKEMMNGTGAIDVPAGSPSVHKGKCVQCHMPPTSYSRGAVQLGGNHTFKIIEPGVAAEASPIPIATTTPSPGASPVVATAGMPYSACSTCHAKAGDPLATYLQGTLEDRQATMQDRIDGVTAELVAASGRMGYTAGADDATTIADTLAAIAAKKTVDADNRTASDINFQKGYTNRTFVEAEGSLGIHNYAYASAVIAKALEEAQAAKASLTGISCVPSTVTLTYGGALTVTGTVTGPETPVLTQPGLVGGQVKLWRQTAGSTWNVVGSTYLDGDNSNQYEFVVMPSANAIYKAQFVGTDTYEAITSAPTASVAVAWNVTFKASKTKVKKNAYITFSGTVAPTAAAVGKTVQLQKKSGAVYVDWTGKTAIVGADGKWSIKIKMTKVGKMALLAKVAGDATHADGLSISKTITTTK